MDPLTAGLATALGAGILTYGGSLVTHRSTSEATLTSGQAAFIGRLQDEVKAQDTRYQELEDRTAARISALEERVEECEKKWDESQQRERELRNDRDALRLIITEEVRREADRYWPGIDDPPSHQR